MRRMDTASQERQGPQGLDDDDDDDDDDDGCTGG